MKSSRATISKLPYWVKAPWIMEVTGWDKHKMKRARDQKVVIIRGTKETGYEYDLNSIHPLLIKKSSTAETVTA